MRIQLLLSSLLLCLIMTSCGDDEVSGTMENTGDPAERKFTIDLGEQASGYDFISITNQEGEMLLGGLLSDEDDGNSFTLDVKETDIIDVTFGTEWNTSFSAFSLYTIRDVRSDFELSREFLNCIGDFHEPLATGKTVKLEIRGISSYNSLVLPFKNKEWAVDESANKIIMTGLMPPERDFLVTVVDENDVAHSKLILEEEWRPKEDAEAYLSLEISDFSAPEIHEVSLNKSDNWMVNAEMSTTEGRVFKLSNWANYEDYQEGSKVRIYTLPEMEKDKIKLDLSGSSSYQGFDYVRILNEIPTSIDLYDPVMEIDFVGNQNYGVTASTDCDFSIVTYSYSQDNFGSSWRIYQRGGGDIMGELPELPDAFVDAAPVFNNQKDNPNRVTVDLIRLTQSSDLEDLFSSAAIEADRMCIDYDASWNGTAL